MLFLAGCECMMTNINLYDYHLAVQSAYLIDCLLLALVIRSNSCFPVLYCGSCLIPKVLLMFGISKCGPLCYYASQIDLFWTSDLLSNNEYHIIHKGWACLRGVTEFNGDFFSFNLLYLCTLVYLLEVKRRAMVSYTDKNMSDASFNQKRLSIDIRIPPFLLERRGGISFGAATSSSRPRLGVNLLWMILIHWYLL